MAIQIEGQNSKDSVDFDEALAAAGTGRFQHKIVLIGGFALMCSYIAVGATSFLLPAAQCDLQMNSTDKGRLMSVGFLGIAVSCHLWGFLSDTLGRRYVLTRCLFVDGLLYIITSLSPNYVLILIWRFCNGFASCGGIVSLYAYIGEFHSDKSRLKALMIMSFFASSTYFLLPVFAWIILPGKWSLMLYPGLVFKSWRLYYACNGLPSLFCSFLIYFLPESPKFFLVKGNKTKALEVLQRIHNENSRKDVKTDYLVKNIVLNEYGEVAKTDENSNKTKVFFILMWNQTVPLFRAPHRLSIVLICILQFLLYLSNGGVYLWLPETLNRIANYKNECGDKSATYCDIIQYRKKEIKYNSRNEDLFLLSTSSVEENNTVMLFSENSSQQPICKSEIDFTVYLHLEILGIISTSILGLIVILTSFFDKKHIIELFLLVSLLCSICLLVVKMTQIIPITINVIIILSGACIPIINSMAVDLFPTNLRAMASCFTLMSSRLGTITANALSGSFIDSYCSILVWCYIISFGVSTILISLLPKKPLHIKEVKKIVEEI